MEKAAVESLATWQIGHYPISELPAKTAPFDRELLADLQQLGATLADEEAVIRSKILNGADSILLLIREKDTIWLVARGKLRKSENLEDLVKTYSVLARGSDATVITDVAGNLLAASSNWRKIYGYSLGELFGRNPRLINSRLQPSSFYQAMWQDLINRDLGTWSAELINRRRNGELVRVWQTITTVRDNAGNIQGYFGQTRDMTSHVAFREQLQRQNDNLKELSEFRIQMMEIMVHDLKSPLQTILGNLELIDLQLSKKKFEAVPKKLKSIENGGRNMLSLVQNFLELQRSNAGKLSIAARRGDLRSLLRSLCEAYDMSTGQRNVRVELEASGAAVPACFDPLRIEQAIGNLLSNAIKYTAQESRVVVSVTNQSGKHALITVQDEGPGIPEDQLELIFEPYKQLENSSDFSGSIGWGLAIARKVMELHDGKLHAENRDQGGCTMVAQLPLGYNNYYSSIHSVLLHDPQESWCHMLMTFFERMEIPCFFSSSPSTCQQLCCQELPAVILLDVDTPCELPQLLNPESRATLNPLVLELSKQTASHPNQILQVAGDERFKKLWDKLMNKYLDFRRSLVST